MSTVKTELANQLHIAEVQKNAGATDAHDDTGSGQLSNAAANVVELGTQRTNNAQSGTEAMNSWNHLITRNLMVVLLLFAIAVPAFAAATTMVRVWEETDITVDSRVRLADIVLRPGSYYVQHAPAPGRHAVLFTDINNPTVVVRAKCRLKRLNGIANYTAIYFGSDPNGHRKLASLVIAGENVMHVF